jgi:ABC-2 type transport system permease protein
MISVETKNIIRREFKRILERKTLYLLMIILPLFVSILYVYVYKSEIVRNIPVAIFDEDHSSLSRTYTEYVEASSSMSIAGYVSSIEELKKGIQSGTYHAGFFIPRNFENDIKAGKNSTVIIYKNTSNLIIGNTILRDGMTISKTISAGAIIKKLRNKGMIYEQAYNIANPIKVESQTLYNPNYSYLGYLVPGLLAFTLQLIIMVSSVIVISSEFTHETFHELLEITHNNIYKILIGKSLPHLLIHSATIFLIIGIIMPIAGIRAAGSPVLIILFFILFTAACLSFGIFISCAFHDQMFATSLALFINMPAFIYSGYTFPLWAMPLAHRIAAALLPFTHLISGYFKLYQMGAPVQDILDETLILILFIIAGFILSVIALKINVKKYYKIKV